MSLVLQPIDDPVFSPVADVPVMLRVRLLGMMAATDAGGASVLPRARKTRAVLAVLALAAPRPDRKSVV